MRVLDTDVSIEILRGNPSILKHRLEIEDEVVTTWITAAELYYGAAKSSRPAEQGSLVVEFLSTLRVLGLQMESVQSFGVLKAGLELQGKRLADADLFIASIVLSSDAVLVTGNIRHYRRIPHLRVEDWTRD